MVSTRSNEDLGLVLETPEGVSVKKPIAIAYERRSKRVGRGGMGALGVLVPGGTWVAQDPP
jgi:hypothetical protein